MRPRDPHAVEIVVSVKDVSRGQGWTKEWREYFDRRRIPLGSSVADQAGAAAVRLAERASREIDEPEGEER